MVGANGFEPSTSWSRTRRSSQAEPRPDCYGTNLVTSGRSLVPIDLADKSARSAELSHAPTDPLTHFSASAKQSPQINIAPRRRLGCPSPVF
jgi:hypothetical protein